MAATDFDSPLSRMLTYLFPGDCFEQLFIHFNILHETCVSLVLSRCLGVAILAGSIFVKVPQIVKLLRAGSGEGVSVTAVMLELICVSVTAAYSYAKKFQFGTWGESLFIAVQNIVIVTLLFWYQRKQPNAFILWTFSGVFLAAAKMAMIPLSVLTWCQFANIPIVVAARGIQISANQKNQSTGQLSIITVGLTFFGSIARIFTSVQETGDSLTIWTYALTSAMNGVLFAQFFMYWGQALKRKSM